MDGGRYRQWVYHWYLSPTARQHVRIHAIDDQRYDETNWWRSRSGLKKIFGAYIHLAYALSGQVESPPGPRFDPDRYEQQLRQRQEQAR